MNKERILLRALVLAATGAAVYLLLPLAAVMWVPAESGMMASAVLLFVAWPLYAIISGLAAGWGRCLWHVPAVNAVLCIAGAWGILGGGVFTVTFLMSGVICMVLSLVALAMMGLICQ